MKYNTNINHNSTHKSDFVVKEDTQGHNFLSLQFNIRTKIYQYNVIVLAAKSYNYRLERVFSKENHF